MVEGRTKTPTKTSLNYSVELRGAAERDVAEAIDWYSMQEPALGHAFLNDFSEVVGRLSETPLLYHVVYRNSRRVQLRRFPYLIWFSVKGQVVTIRACLRGSINPSRMRRRLR